VRLVGILVIGILAVTVVAQGAFLFKTRKQVAALSDQVQQMAAESALDDRPLPESRERLPVNARPLGAPPPRFTPPPPAQPTAPAVAALTTPEAREQVHQMVLEAMDRAREDNLARMRERREQDQMRRIDDVVKAMKLNTDDSQRLSQVLTAAQQARRDLRDKMTTGEVSRADAAQQMAALRAQTDEQLNKLLGDDGRRKLEETQRQVGGFGPGGGGGGPGGFFGGGRARGGAAAAPAP
jgi:hypothetical protein